MTRPACHPDRPHCARGLCRSCYRADWGRRKRRRRRIARRRPCDLCGRAFTPYLLDAGLYCSRLCALVACARTRSGSEGEEFHATRSREAAETIARAYVERGCQRVGKRIAGKTTTLPFVVAWHRGEGLYLIRARLPERYREEATA